MALGLLAHVAAFGRAFSLRSGCDLRPVDSTWTWRGEDADEEMVALTRDAATALLREAIDRAEAAGLPVGSRWAEPLVLEPKENLRKVIRSTFPVPEV